MTARIEDLTRGQVTFTDSDGLALEVPDGPWQPALSADGTEHRDHAEVAEVADLDGLAGAGRFGC